MSLSLSLALFSLILLFLFQLPADAKSITVSVQQYTGLKRSDIRGLENQYYYFQFCSCPKTVTERTVQTQIDQCSCSDAQKAKKLDDSIPQAKFAFSSSTNCATGACLNGKVNDELGTGKLFVKVLIGSTVLTSPDYQLLVVSSTKRDAILKTVKPSKIRLTYTCEQDLNENDEVVEKDTSRVAIENSHWSNSILHDAHGSATGFFSRITSQKKAEMKNSMMNGVDMDIGAIKSFLFAKSRVDKLDPVRYDIPKLKEWIVSYHNVYRSKHNAPALVPDLVLDARGKRWADELAYHKGCLVHEQPRTYGENLFFFGARHLPTQQTLAAAVVQSFYLEGIGYNYSSWRPMSFFKTGHFTQLVWKESRRIGVGVSIVKASSLRSPCVSGGPNMYLIFVVVKYDPAGNFESHKAYLRNVERPIA
uniref:SCP domain-containing protein n=1 Tax=Caenorhabditis japonica TaxID=281687 RepID=A0A8R1I283_CAEJA